MRTERLFAFSCLGLVIFSTPTFGSSLADQLTGIRKRIFGLEQSLLEGTYSQKGARTQVKKIQALLDLQRKERMLGEKRLSELEKTVLELETRKASLNQKMIQQRHGIRRFLMALEATNRNDSPERSRALNITEQERLEAPRRRAIANLVERGLKEVEVLKADLEDAAQLENRIQDERQQLAFLIQDLKEQAGILELNRQLQVDLLKKKKVERIGQLANYQRLKSAEAQVEHLIGEFNARKELERVNQAEKEVSAAMAQTSFFRQKGRLPMPITGGKVVGNFGRTFDPQSGLYVFRKGIEIMTAGNQAVRAISDGKVAFSGTLPHYGQVVIIDHGNHFYSLCGHLGSVLKKARESVRAGDRVGLSTGDSRTPLYFEIRARNVAVNPLQWVFN